MMVFMQIGEVIFGGVGSGLYGILLYVVLAVFLAGLMVGGRRNTLVARYPVIFVTAIVAAMTTILALRELFSGAQGAGFALQVTVWLWIAVLVSTFAEALAEGRGRARADSLRTTKAETMVRLLGSALPTDFVAMVPSSSLRQGQFVRVDAGDLIPTDAEIVLGVASVDESAITGESAPVIRESGGDRSSVTGGMRVVSDLLILRITAEPGKSFLDRMIAPVEGAERQKTPN